MIASRQRHRRSSSESLQSISSSNSESVESTSQTVTSSSAEDDENEVTQTTPLASAAEDATPTSGDVSPLIILTLGVQRIEQDAEDVSEIAPVQHFDQPSPATIPYAEIQPLPATLPPSTTDDDAEENGPDDIDNKKR